MKDFFCFKKNQINTNTNHTKFNCVHTYIHTRVRVSNGYFPISVSLPITMEMNKFTLE